jgi:hypothetical protein
MKDLCGIEVCPVRTRFSARTNMLEAQVVVHIQVDKLVRKLLI